MNQLASLYIHFTQPRRVAQDVRTLYELDESRFPITELIPVFVSCAILALSSIIRHILAPQQSVCSVNGAVLWFVQQLLLILLVRSTASSLRAWHEQRLRLGFVFELHDVRWTPREIRTVSIVCMSIGCVAALVGVGPAVLLTPALLVLLKMEPLVVQATSAVLNAACAAAVVVQVGLDGMLEPELTLILASTACLAAVCGLILAYRVVTRYKIQWLIVAILALVLVISLCLSIAVTSQTFLLAKSIGNTFPIRPFCAKTVHKLRPT
eukprot:CAMPEP_0182443156 /NCGR_PEP_ID=MMETSP1172-20130603/1957_1 /TAXON_ID=708627 /ORGANISM="Timspurckia oligopyrenoides, Strain CCMP3278" /LENGTH=266 /DNA_ID=CAMNT_0024638327 /DNA_START=903 /DNA_END=1700 /DNA_ORIENTATION=-